MSYATLLADELEKRKRAVAACNDVAKKLVGQLHPFMGKDAEAMLSAEEDLVMSLAMDLVDKREELKAAHDDYEALKRRGQ